MRLWFRFFTLIVFGVICCVQNPSWAQSYKSSLIDFKFSSGSFTDVKMADDSVTSEISLGFTFRFGDVDYKTVRIQSNGRLQFNNTFNGHGTQTTGSPPTYPFAYPTGLPGGSSANVARTMRIYGADLDPGSGGRVRYAQSGTAPNRTFVVEWDNVPEWSSSGSNFRMQVILKETGEFEYHYTGFVNASKGVAQTGWMVSEKDYEVVSTSILPATSKREGMAIRFTPTSAASVTSFDLNVGGAAASTCTAKQITITARDGSGSTLASYVGTIQLSTSTNRGDWTVVTGAGALANGSANDGAATYTFSASDKGIVTLALTNSHADDLTVSVVDSGAPSSKSTSSAINFRDNAFVLTPDPIQIAGRSQSIGVALWSKDATSGNCAIATGYTGTRALDAWITRDVQDPGGAAPTVGGVALPSAVPGTNASSNNVSLTFSAGQATLALATTDVGKYVLNLRDDTRSFASGVDIVGTSASITTRPFALGFTEIKQGGGTCSPAAGAVVCNTSGTATSGAKFVAAGDTFQTTVGGYLWSAADDANNDGVPDAGATITDNALAPSFAWTTSLSATTPISPAAGITGALSGTTSLSQASFSGGRAVASALTYAEVGSVTLLATATDYLGTSGATVNGTSGAVGRFYPGRFYVSSPSGVTAACVAGGFSYMGQSAFTVSVTIEAQTTTGARVQNYRKPDYPVGSVSVHAENANSGTDLGARLSGLTPTLDWNAGNYVVVTASAGFARAASPDGPFDSLQLGVTVTDPDGAVLTARNMNPTTNGDCAASGNCTAVAIGAATKMRFGRLRVQSASGSELLPLTVPIEAQYWNGTGFTRNTSDSCTAIPAGAVALGAYAQRGGGTLSPAPTAVTMPGGAMSAGTKVLTLTAPGAGKGGDAQIVVNLGASASESLCVADTFNTTGGTLSWLRGRWCGDSYDRDPAGRVTFGIRRAATALVYQRENF